MSIPHARRWAGLAVLASLGAPLLAKAQIPSPEDNLSFYAVAPACRLFDTRTGAQGGPLDTNTPEPPPPAPPTASSVTRSYQIRGHCGIPAEAQAITFNLTIVAQPYAGHLTLFADGTVPTASNLNFIANQTTSNGGVVKLGVEKDLAAKLFLGGAPLQSRANIILDVTGFFAP